MGELQHSLFAWLATYALHSTVLLLLALLLTRRFPHDAFRAREWVWKTALLGPLLTSSLQSGVHFEPLAGRLALPAATDMAAGGERGPAPTSAGDRADHEQRVAFLRTVRERTAAGGATAGEPRGLLTDSPPLPRVERQPALAAAGTAAEPRWQPILLGAWAGLGVLGACLLALAWSRVVDRLAGRVPLTEGPLAESLAALCERARVSRPRLALAARLASPATIGVLRPQICVPERALSELSPEQQEAMLAHELAHVVRRDPQWFFLTRLLERLFFFQPLNHLAKKRIIELAEYQADDWAVGHTERSLSLARCLTEVASWIVIERTRVAVLPMVERGSQLSLRVRRLLDDERRATRKRSRLLTVPLTSALLVAVAFVLPGAAASDAPVTPTGPRAEPAPPATDVAPDVPRSSEAALPRASGPAARLGELLVPLENLNRQIDELSTVLRELEVVIEREELGSDLELRYRELRIRIDRLCALRSAAEEVLLRFQENPADQQPERPTAASGQEQ